MVDRSEAAGVVAVVRDLEAGVFGVAEQSGQGLRAPVGGSTGTACRGWRVAVVVGVEAVEDLRDAQAAGCAPHEDDADDVGSGGIGNQATATADASVVVDDCGLGQGVAVGSRSQVEALAREFGVVVSGGPVDVARPQ